MTSKTFRVSIRVLMSVLLGIVFVPICFASATINPPVASNGSVNTTQGSSIATPLSGTDAQGSILRYILVSHPKNGILLGKEPNYTYVPDKNFSGIDSFTYKVSNGVTDSNIATYTITVARSATAAIIKNAVTSNSFDQGFVSLTFDDGLLSQYQNALPILDAANVKGSFYIITHTAGMAVTNPSLDLPDSANSNKPLGWVSSGGSGARFTYPVTGQSGKAAEVSATASGSNAAWNFTPVSVLPDENYVYVDTYRSTAATDILIQMTDANGKLTYINSSGDAVTNKVAALTLPSTKGTWVTLPSKLFYVPVTVKTITVLHRLTGAGLLDVDAVSLGEFTNSMTPAQVLTLQAHGHEVGGHTQTHPDLTTLTTAAQTTEIAGGRQDLLNYGITSPSTFVYPYGSFTATTEQVVQQTGYVAARTVTPGYNDRSSDHYALLAQSMYSDTTVAQVESWIDQAKANKQWLIIVFHPVQTDLTGELYGATPQTLQTIVSYLTTNNVPVLTMAQGAAKMSAPVPPTPTPVPPTPTGANLILNPSFVTANPTNSSLPQNWSQGGWGTNTTVFTYPVVGTTDAKAAKVQINSFTNGDAKWVFDKVAVTPGHTYVYADAYQSTIPSTLIVEYTNTSGAVSYAGGTSVPASTGWATSTTSFTAPSGTASARVFHYIAGVGSLTIDDASLADLAGGTTPPPVIPPTPTPTPTPTPPAPVPPQPPATTTNLVLNPSFVTANASNASLPQNWSQGGWGTNKVTFSYPVTGTIDGQAAKVQLTSFTSGDAKWVFDPVAVTAGASYTYTDAYQASLATQLVVEYKNASNVYSYANYTAIPASASAWGSASVTFTPPTGTVFARVFHLMAGVGSLTIDDASLVKI